MALGEMEQVLLFALVRLKGEAHGAAIAEEIEEQTGRRISAGALYTSFERLEQKGYVASWLGDSTPERGGRRRRCYRVMPAGAAELKAAYASLQRLASGMENRLDALAGDAGS
jgi:DNA-binding PadR family transcriptional regulator